MSILAWVSHADWTCSEQFLRSRHWSLSPGLVPQLSVTPCQGRPRLCEDRFSCTVVWQSTALQHTWLQFIRDKSKDFMTHTLCVIQCTGDQGFLSAYERPEAGLMPFLLTWKQRCSACSQVWRDLTCTKIWHIYIICVLPMKSTALGTSRVC